MGRTQQQRSEETRTAILDAAIESLVEVGFSGTTTTEVQKRAGVSRGALLHHFPAKAGLLVATVHHLAKLRGRELKARAVELPSGPERVDAAITLLWESFRGPLFCVGAELRFASRTDADLRRALVEAEQVLWDRIRAQAAQLFGPEIAAQPGFRVTLELTLHLMMGAAATNMVHGGASESDRLIAVWRQLWDDVLGAVEQRI